MNQDKMPLLGALRRHIKQKPVSFHVPGHKNGRLMPDGVKNLFSDALLLDQTELCGLDDLHDPAEAILEAQELTASLYGAKRSFFLTGGSTSGNQAMILASFQRGDRVLVQRDAHKSVLNGLRLAGVKPVFIFSEYDSVTQLPTGLNPKTVQQAFSTYRDAKGLIITSPSYYGWTAKVSELIETAHQHGAAVLVDEAHGAHFITNECFPPSSLQEGVDAAVHSAHKTLPALTMGAFLHVGSQSMVDEARLKECAALLQSSSPSYVIMASLDSARHYAYQLKCQNREALEPHLLHTRNQILEATGLEAATPPYGVKQDLLKLILTAPAGYDGFTLQRCLEKNGIYSELADTRHVLLLLGLSTEPLSEEVLGRLQCAARLLKKTKPAVNDEQVPFQLEELPLIEADLSYGIFEQKETKTITLSSAIGEYPAVDITPYPPGVPLFLKNEQIDERRYSFLLQWLKGGGRAQGIKKDFRGHWCIDVYKRKETI
ncbi:aminotransferase class I/II-fold pyridoxal phosphate-dependent enzyme [Alteribacillus sp. HJP-4]|uniref:aminotransferase class I/II-fold pyridoxal phosphate-dependent enzyme n=1 Tax=Alteribacillus sp. HJP-4 TaxID=2775394 RepID=UPI0035CD360E